MVFNTTSAEVIDRIDLETPLTLALVKQTLYGCLGVGIGLLLCRFPLHTIVAQTPKVYWIAIVLLLLVFVPYVGHKINDARRWIGFGFMTFQPSEFIKILLPLFVIHSLQSHRGPFLFKDFLRMLAMWCLPIALILFEPDHGTAALLFVTLVTLFFLLKVRWLYWGLPLTLLLIVGVGFAATRQLVHDRIQIYLHPERDLLGRGHQPYQAKIAVGSGGVIGKGFGESLQKMNYLPEARSDYIAAIFGEEFGFVGICFLLLLYLSLGYFGFKIALQAKDREGFYVATLLTFLILFQAFLNLGVVSGLLPSKGLNLPLFSHGGSSLIMNFISIFLIINVSLDSHGRRWNRRPSLSR